MNFLVAPAVEPGRILEARDVTFRRQGLAILDGITWQFEAGQRWTLLGPNGSGKSTLIRIFSGYEWPTGGRVWLFNKRLGDLPVAAYRRRLGLFQPALWERLPVYHSETSALEVIATGWNGSLAAYADFAAGVEEQARDLFDRYSNKLRGSFPLDRPYRLLSTGERRKLLLLRMLMNRPELLILDEPYESLDVPSRAEMEWILLEYARRQNCAILSVFHRIEEILPGTTHAFLLKKGRTFFQGPLADALEEKRLSDLYEVPLFAGERNGRYYCFPARPA